MVELSGRNMDVETPKHQLEEGQESAEVVPEKKLPYPKSVFFIVSNEFCERFNYYGMRTVLVLYLTKILLYSEADAKVIYHSFNMFCYFFPVFGAIISDSYLGKFNTIFYVSMIYACGSVLLTLTSVDPLGFPQQSLSVVSLLLMAIGAGGIKPCVAAFGGDQFVLPQQEKQIASFFSLFYFSINAGSLISTFLTPVLRNDVHCFGRDSCFPLAFAVPGILMVISIVVFAAGRPLYKIKKPQGNVVVEVAKCITHAIKQKTKSKEPKPHWLDHSIDKYGPKLVNDIKSTLHVLVLYLPLPIFWALYDQQGSGWTFQAVRMNGDIGIYTILPDQVQVVNPLLILSFIPLFTYVLYPLLAKINLLKTSLQRMVCGGFLAALAFAVSALISIAIEKGDPLLPSNGNMQLRIYNPSNYDYVITPGDIYVDKNSYYVDKDVGINGVLNADYYFTAKDNEGGNFVVKNVTVSEAKAYGIFIMDKNAIIYEDNVEKSETGYPLVRTLKDFSKGGYVRYVGKKKTMNVTDTDLVKFSYPGTYSVEINGKDTGKSVKFELGGTYSVLITDDNNFSTHIITEPNSVHILWLLPQYFIITAAEIMFSITGLEFSYSQAPATMKSLLQACFLLTTAFGNLIIVIIESAKIFEKQSNDFFLYTGLMVVDMLIFTFMAMRYKYIDVEDAEDAENSDNSEQTLPEIDDNKKHKTGIDNPTFVQN